MLSGNNRSRLALKELLSMQEEEGLVTLDTSITTTLSEVGTGSKMAALKPLKPTLDSLTQTETNKWLA